MKMSSTTVTVPALLAAPDRAFETVIFTNLGREASRELWEMLLHPDVTRRTYEALNTKYRELERQKKERGEELAEFERRCFARGQGGIDDWHDAEDRHNEWLRKTGGYMRMLGYRLSQAERALPRATKYAPPNGMDPARRASLMDTIFRLAWVIDRHRERCSDLGIPPDMHDVTLWRSLGDITVETGKGTTTVYKFLQELRAREGFEPPTDI